MAWSNMAVLGWGSSQDLGTAGRRSTPRAPRDDPETQRISAGCGASSEKVAPDSRARIVSRMSTTAR